MLIPIAEIEQVDKPIALIARARYSLFSGTVDEAQIFFNDARQLDNTMREALLLEGEFALLDGRPEDARTIFESLSADQTSTPEWIRLFAQQLMSEIQ